MESGANMAQRSVAPRHIRATIETTFAIFKTSAQGKSRRVRDLGGGRQRGQWRRPAGQR